MKREGSGVNTELARFAKKIVGNAQKAVVGTPAPAVNKGESGYADWLSSRFTL